ncbi:MAG TPA: S1C family serine protease [Acidimicrobiales bacterium]|nr:S1C family serine protease [Acidimicrobiales bacterium]
MGVVEELERAATAVAEKVGPAVVRIGRAPGRGAGVVIAAGQVVTNAHNLRGEHTTVTFTDGRVEMGRVAGVDVDGDLAVVAADTAAIAAPDWAGPASAGLPVFALARSAAGGLRVSFGLVSTVGQAFRGPRGRRIVGSIEHTAPLRRGSSGGPVVDGAGRLLGVNTHRLGDGFYLALPADDELRARLDALARGQSPRRRHLGVALAPAEAARHLRRAVGLPERDGLLVRAVQPGSPAERAGLRQGDLIVAASGDAVASADALHAALDAVDEGGSLALRIVRGSEELDVTVAFPGADEANST